MLSIAVALLVLDACVVAWLLACARLSRRRRVASARRTEAARAASERAAADAANADLTRRQTEVRARWAERSEATSAHPGVGGTVERLAMAPPGLPGVMPRTGARPVSVRAQLLDAADRLAATEVLTYDPAVWDGRH